MYKAAFSTALHVYCGNSFLELEATASMQLLCESVFEQRWSREDRLTDRAHSRAIEAIA